MLRSRNKQQLQQSPTKKNRRDKRKYTTIDDDDDYDNEHDANTKLFLQGLTLAGLAAYVLTTIFGLFHIDVFLRVYELPLHSFATGNVIFVVVNTINGLLGAWWIDQRAANAAATVTTTTGTHHQHRTASRTVMVGVSGCMLCMCFLAPFFRWMKGITHFVLSMSLYDTMYSFIVILMGSVITDNHKMNDNDRIDFMASGKVVNLILGGIVARYGLEIFEENDMEHFQLFLLLLAIVVCIMFVVAQIMMDISSSNNTNTNSVINQEQEQQQQSATTTTTTKRTLQIKQVVKDFWYHTNFRAWIGMELLLESQNTFCQSFLKTFVDRLILNHDPFFTRHTCDWFLSLSRPATQIATILCYIPIRKVGYPKVYMSLFVFNLILSLLCLLFGSPSNPYVTISYLGIYNVMTGAVQSAGFHLAMSDMVLEMKYKQTVIEGRYDEPSLAGLFMGANALLCKPMESFLPVVAALVLSDGQFSQNLNTTHLHMTGRPDWVLFYLLVLPPLFFSGLQILSWSYYNLIPTKTEKLRHELLQRLKSNEDIIGSTNTIDI